MPQVLMELMRHESVETTNRFYVGRNAKSTAAVLWATVGRNPQEGNRVGNTTPDATKGAESKSSPSAWSKRVSESSGDGTRTRDSRIMNQDATSENTRFSDEAQRVCQQLRDELPARVVDLMPSDPELASVVTAWPNLIEQVKRAILALVRSG